MAELNLSRSKENTEALAVPTGTVITSFATTTPDGYLYCDGNPISRSTYLDLFVAIGTASGNGDGSTTFNKPDLRGRFLRGQDDTSGQDPDAGSRAADAAGGNINDNVGSVQDDEYESHNHNILPTLAGNASGAGDYLQGATNDDNYGTGNTSNAGGSTETRPKNVNVRYYIKY